MKFQLFSCLLASRLSFWIGWAEENLQIIEEPEIIVTGILRFQRLGSVIYKNSKILELTAVSHVIMKRTNIFLYNYRDLSVVGDIQTNWIFGCLTFPLQQLKMYKISAMPVWMDAQQLRLSFYVVKRGVSAKSINARLRQRRQLIVFFVIAFTNHSPCFNQNDFKIGGLCKAPPEGRSDRVEWNN